MYRRTVNDQGEAKYVCHDKAWHGKMRQSNALQDEIKQVKIRQSIGYALRASEQQIVKSKTKLNKAKQGKARQGKARQGNLHEVTNGDKKTE